MFWLMTGALPAMSIIKSDSAPVDTVMQAGFYGYDVALIAMPVCVADIGLAVMFSFLVIRDWEKDYFTIAIVADEISIEVDAE